MKSLRCLCLQHLRGIACTCIFLLAACPGYAQHFTLTDSLRVGAYGAAAWGDYDGDGRQDLAYSAQTLQTGMPDFFYVYHNTTAGFVRLAQAFPFYSLPAIRWADLDNDGKADLIRTGMDSLGASHAQLYKSNGDGTFTAVTGIHVPGFLAGYIDVADYNNDGWKDILLTGYDSALQISTAILKGAGAFAFTSIPTRMAGITGGEAKWGDFNNDGRTDVLMSGISADGFRAYVYQNMGADSFSRLPLALAGGPGTADWLDYDGDGFRDILLAGFDSSGATNFTDLYHNNGGNGNFTKQVGNLPKFGEPVSAAVADFNKDGKPDICFNGGTDFSFNYAALALGTGTANFRLDTFGFQGDIQNSIVEDADINNDGYPDLFFGNIILKNRVAPAGVMGVVKQDMELHIVPTPTLATASVSWTMNASGPARIAIYTLSGSLVREQSVAAAVGINSCTIDIAGAPAATYLVVVQSAGGYDLRRMVKL